MGSDLNDLIRKKADEHPDAQDSELAHLVAKATPKAQLMTWYADLLLGKIREIKANDRNNAIRAAARPVKDRSKKARPAKKTASGPASKKATQAPVNISAKLARRRAMKWEKVFETPIPVNGKDILIGDFTVADFDWVIADHELRAGQIVASGDRYQAWKDVVVAHGVEHFRDLPEAALEELEDAA